MKSTTEMNERQRQIDELKRLILAGKHESLETLEDAVDALLWSERDRLQALDWETLDQIAPSHLKYSHPK